MLFCLQFSTSLACGIEQIAEHDSLFHIYMKEADMLGNMYLWDTNKYTHIYVISDQNH